MQYTKYLSQMIAAQGSPNMDTAAFRKIMNIVHLEGRNSVLKELKSRLNDGKYQYDIEILKNDQKLAGITGNFPPDVAIPKILKGEMI